jgi:hypothetical protein
VAPWSVPGSARSMTVRLKIRRDGLTPASSRPCMLRHFRSHHLSSAYQHVLYLSHGHFVSVSSVKSVLDKWCELKRKYQAFVCWEKFVPQNQAWRRPTNDSKIRARAQVENFDSSHSRHLHSAPVRSSEPQELRQQVSSRKSREMMISALHTWLYDSRGLPNDTSQGLRNTGQPCPIAALLKDSKR